MNNSEAVKRIPKTSLTAKIFGLSDCKLKALIISATSLLFIVMLLFAKVTQYSFSNIKLSLTGHNCPYVFLFRREIPLQQFRDYPRSAGPCCFGSGDIASDYPCRRFCFCFITICFQI